MTKCLRTRKNFFRLLDNERSGRRQIKEGGGGGSENLEQVVYHALLVSVSKFEFSHANVHENQLTELEIAQLGQSLKVKVTRIRPIETS